MKGTFITIQNFIQSFGGEGTIINLVSLAAALPGPGSSSYSSTKLAMISIGQNLSLGTHSSLLRYFPMSGKD